LKTNSNLIETKTISDLPSGSSIVVTFAWDTIPVPKGNYTISAAASIIPGEIDTEDNTHIDGQVQETILGDVTGDGKVNILDVAKVAKAFLATETDPQWDPNVDLDNSGQINIVDISKVAKEFGKVDP
jgi:cytoskeletal protein CcmA (bactofilin family)